MAFTNQIDNQGHAIKPGKLGVTNHAEDSTRKLQGPITVTDLKLFLGRCSVFRRFVLNFLRITSPLLKRLCGIQAKNLGPLTKEELEVLEPLQGKLIAPPVLTFLKSNGQYTLGTDSCDGQIGCVLLQNGTIATESIRYWSGILKNQEKNLVTTHSECFVAVRAAVLLRSNLDGCRFIMRTDRHELRWILNLANATGELAG